MHSLFYLLVTLAILVTIHEYGHFWVARRCGVKVLKFSIGFGKSLWSHKAKDGTEYSVSAIPLGGYVKMLDEREGEVNKNELNQAFNRKSLSKRTAIVAAGPIANLLFAIIAYWLVFLIGVPGQKPLIGDIDLNSPAYYAQLNSGDEIIAVNGQATPTWSSVNRALSEVAISGGDVSLQVLSNAIKQDRHIQIEPYDFSHAEKSLLNAIGVTPFHIPIKPIIAAVTDDGAAKRAGVLAGDEIISIDDVAISSWQQLVDIVQTSGNKSLKMDVKRAGTIQTLMVTPSLNDQNIGKIGAMVDSSKTDIDPQYLSIEHYGFFGGFIKAVKQTWSFSTATLSSIWGMIMGEVSSKNIGGPVTIAQYAGSSADSGFVSFLSFLAAISISLGLLNLLPIPVLDGGHLALYLVEGLRGRPLSDEVQLQLQKIGIITLLMLMFLAFFNDLTRLFG